MKQKDIPYKERQRHYDYQFNRPYKDEELAMRKEEKRLRKLKEQFADNGKTI